MASRKRWRHPAALLRHLGIEAPRDLDVEAIAQYCGATVVYEPLHGCTARLVAHRDRAIITVDPDVHSDRQSFSTAHELGHWMLDRHRASFACTEAMLNDRRTPARGNHATDAPEKRANRWAADLLMPEYLFVPSLRDRPITLDTARNLTRDFRASFFAAALRMLRFSPLPCMIVWSRPGQRYKWFRRSPRMPRSIWPLPEPGPSTVAHRMLQTGDKHSRPTLVPQGEWIAQPSPYRGDVVEDSMLMQNGEVYTLLVWIDETPT